VNLKQDLLIVCMMCIITIECAYFIVKFYFQKMPGVVDFLTSSNIPAKGENSFNDGDKEEVFCSGEVLYAGQALGLIVAGMS